MPEITQKCSNPNCPHEVWLLANINNAISKLQAKIAAEDVKSPDRDTDRKVQLKARLSTIQAQKDVLTGVKP